MLYKDCLSKTEVEHLQKGVWYDHKNYEESSD